MKFALKMTLKHITAKISDYLANNQQKPLGGHMKFNNLVIVTFVFSLQGCGTLQGGFNGLKADLQGLRGSPAQQGPSPAIDKKTEDQYRLNDLSAYFRTPGADPKVALLKTQDIGNQEAYDKLVGEYFLGNTKDAVKWFELNKNKKFATALLGKANPKLSSAEQMTIVTDICDQDVTNLWISRNFPSSKKQKAVVKDCKKKQ